MKISETNYHSSEIYTYIYILHHVATLIPTFSLNHFTKSNLFIYLFIFLCLLVLIGAGECGKSTILKQMKILHLDGFKSASERATYKSLIYKNTLECMQTLCTACEQLSIPFDSPSTKERSVYLLSLSLTDVPLTILPDLQLLWSDSGIQTAFSRSNEFQLLDSTSYFLDSTNLSRIFVETYEPSNKIFYDRVCRLRVLYKRILELIS